MLNWLANNIQPTKAREWICRTIKVASIRLILEYSLSLHFFLYIVISFFIIIIPPNLYNFEITESEGPQHILLAP